MLSPSAAHQFRAGFLRLKKKISNWMIKCLIISQDTHPSRRHPFLPLEKKLPPPPDSLPVECHSPLSVYGVPITRHKQGTVAAFRYEESAHLVSRGNSDTHSRRFGRVNLSLLTNRHAFRTNLSPQTDRMPLFHYIHW